MLKSRGLRFAVRTGLKAKMEGYGAVALECIMDVEPDYRFPKL